MSNDQAIFIQNAESKALATNGPAGINVVPVSVVRVIDGDVVLINFFMEKTARNAEQGGNAAFTAWTGESGIQVKGTLRYQSQGDRFATLKELLEVEFPDRTVYGILNLTPVEVFSVSLPGATIIS